MSVMRFLLLDDTEHHLIGRILEQAAHDGDRAQADAWRVMSTIRCDEFVVHGLTDAGHLMALPASAKLRTWMVARLRASAASGEAHQPAWFAAQLADRIEDERAPAGEPGSVRVGAEDLRALLEATDAWAATLSPAIRADEREEQDALHDLTDRIGTVAAMVWTEPAR